MERSPRRRLRSGALAVVAFLSVLASVTPSWAGSPPVAVAGAVRRVAAVPHPMPAPIVRKVAFIGDSIGRDARHYVRGQVQQTHPISYYEAVAAGYIGYHLPRLLPVIRPSTGPDILLVELGTGDAFWDHGSAQFESDIRRFLDQVLPFVTCVRWFDQKPTANIAYPEVNEHRTAFNRILSRVLAEPGYASQNVALVNYAAWYNLAGDDGYFLADRLHHTEAGRRELGVLAGQAAKGCDPATASGPFWDVPNSSGAANAIGWAGVSGVVAPFRNGTFRAKLGSFAPSVDRGDVADMLWRMAGSPNVGSPDDPAWTDVFTSADLRRATGWLQDQHIVVGYQDNTFRPNGPVTRGDLVTFLWRWAGSPAVEAAHGWNDIPDDLGPAMNWARSIALMPGNADGGFHPSALMTRGATAKALFAFDQAVPDPLGAPSIAGTPAPTLPTTTVPFATPPPAPVPPTTVPSTTPPPATVPPTTPPPATVPPTTVPPINPPSTVPPAPVGPSATRDRGAPPWSAPPNAAAGAVPNSS